MRSRNVRPRRDETRHECAAQNAKAKSRTRQIVWGRAPLRPARRSSPLSGRAWLRNTSASGWISPKADQSTFANDTGSGNYTCRTSFDLTSFDVRTAGISGRWASDNFGLDILVNGVSTGFTHTNGSPVTDTYHSPFAVDSGFVAGVNTLGF
ncbi:MAG TPA: hypothetical protein VF170_01570, partial [Planctomycetaceae bacterium]